MPFPDEYRPRNNFEQDERNGLPVHGSKVYAEYAYIARAVNSIVWFLKGFTLPDGRVNSLQTLAINDMVDEVSHTVSVDGATVFAATNPYSVADDYLRVWRNEVMVPSTEYSHDGVEITFNSPAPTLQGDIIRIRTYIGLNASLTATSDHLASEQGAGQIGLADIEGLYTSVSVEGALQEVHALVSDLWDEFHARTDYVLADGTVALTSSWDVNTRGTTVTPPAPAIGSFDFTAPCATGDTITIIDGVVSRTFEFSNTPATVVGGNVAVPLGIDTQDQANKFVTAMGAEPLAIHATAVNGATFWTIQLTHNVPGEIGNRDIEAFSSSIANVVGMSGGRDQSNLPDLTSSHRIRNLPRGIQDGDPVVLEQLRELQSTLSSGVDFLRTDGESIMDGPLRMGGNRIESLGTAQDDADAVNLAGLNAAIAALDTSLQNYADQAWLRGSYAGGSIVFSTDNGVTVQDPTQVADATQTPGVLPTPSVVTMDGVPIPSQPGHPVNKHHFDTGIAALDTRLDTLEDTTGIADTSTEGMGGLGLDFATATANVGHGGAYHYDGNTTLTGGPVTIDTFLVMRAQGDLTISASIAVNRTDAGVPDVGYIDLSCTGTLTIDADILARGYLKLRATNIVIQPSRDIQSLDDRLDIEATASFTMGTGATAIGRGAAFLRAVDGAVEGELGCLGAAEYAVNGSLSFVLYTTPADTRIPEGGRYGRVRNGVRNPLQGITAANSTVAPVTGAGGGGGAMDGGKGGTGANAGGTDLDGAAYGPLRADASTGYAVSPHSWTLPPAAGGTGGAGSGTDAVAATVNMTHEGAGGGVTIVVFTGDLVANAGVFFADGNEGRSGSFGNVDGGQGGGGGGTVRLAVLGNLTGGTVRARGGDAGDGWSNTVNDSPSGSGGGGHAAIFHVGTPVGTPVASAPPGTDRSPGGVGDTGAEFVIQLDVARITSLVRSSAFPSAKHWD